MLMFLWWWWCSLIERSDVADDDDVLWSKDQKLLIMMMFSNRKIRIWWWWCFCDRNIRSCWKRCSLIEILEVADDDVLWSKDQNMMMMMFSDQKIRSCLWLWCCWWWWCYWWCNWRNHSIEMTKSTFRIHIRIHHQDKVECGESENQC